VTTSTTKCLRNGCTGVIEDGYCGECGHAPAAEPTPGSASPTLAVSASASTPVDPSASAASMTAAPTATSWTTSSASKPSRPSRRTSGRTATSGPTRGQLGGGLVDVPSVPVTDPTNALMSDPQVPEDRRFCSRCGQSVGRSRNSRPGRVDGFCPRDGTPFSFSPKLHPGDLVAGQYEVRGCLAHGGLGWIYLAVDHNVSDRWVVLKGLLDSGDADAMAAAVAERRFLAEVDHPNIVAIHNFVQHPGPDGIPVGYIVMEYVGGSSLKQLLAARRRPDGGYDPIPVAQAIAYTTEVLNALGYLHSRGLVYCDFKPDNAIHYGRQLKLIDLGAVIRMDDQHSAVYGTVGYQAPEVPREGPSVASDLYTVGRSLAVLALGLPPTRSGGPNPIPDDHPVLQANESFHRAILRATDPDPLRRFESAEEMAEQLDGVLCDVLASQDGQPRPSVSTRFGPTQGCYAAGLLLGDASPGEFVPGARPARPEPRRVAAVLPLPRVDPTDAGAGLLAMLSTVDREAVISAIAAAPELTPEIRLRLARAHLDAGDSDAASAALDELAAQRGADDWRLEWFRGLTALVAAGDDAVSGDLSSGKAMERLREAAAAFAVVYATLPGEIAPKLALAAASECAGQDADAGRLYALISRRDPALADACFGLARVALRSGDRPAAVTALDAVPSGSSEYVTAQLSAVTATLINRSGAQMGLSALRTAAARVQRLSIDPATSQRYQAAVLTAALEVPDSSGSEKLFGYPWLERTLRLGLESCLRASAQMTRERAERIKLVDRANAVRPRTWT